MSSERAIEVRRLKKAFDISNRGRLPLRHTLAHPFTRVQGRRLQVLEDVSFDVRRGGFFGVVGRNGSGKSTLLKLLAGIYRADGGTIKVAGRLAPFIELGVGFHPELAALDNVVLNGVMMGLTPSEARRRFDKIIALAGLEEFTDVKLRNYSSGMKVRLGFSVMANVDADVLLIDEVLAVGDAAFQERCGEVFRRLHEQERTILLVTHSMPLVKIYCDRAMLLHAGEIERLGDPDEVADRYLELNSLEQARSGTDARRASAHRNGDGAARIGELWLANPKPESPSQVEQGSPIQLHVVIEVGAELQGPGFFFHIQDRHGTRLFASPVRYLAGPRGKATPGERLRVRVTVENPLTAGRYLVTCGVVERSTDGGHHPVSKVRSLSLDVSGNRRLRGLMSLQHEIEVEREAPAPLAHR